MLIEWFQLRFAGIMRNNYMESPCVIIGSDTGAQSVLTVTVWCYPHFEVPQDVHIRHPS